MLWRVFVQVYFDLRGFALDFFRGSGAVGRCGLPVGDEVVSAFRWRGRANW